MDKFFTIFLILVNVALAVTGQLAIKYGMQHVGYMTAANAFPLLLAALRNTYVLGGLSAYALAAGTWIAVLSRIDVSVAYPMLSIGYVLVLILSVAWLGETVTLSRVFGTCLVIAGVALIFLRS